MTGNDRYGDRRAAGTPEDEVLKGLWAKQAPMCPAAVQAGPGGLPACTTINSLLAAPPDGSDAERDRGRQSGRRQRDTRRHRITLRKAYPQTAAADHPTSDRP
jgi:hypothetical protein